MPQIEPITLDYAKTFLRIDGDHDDAIITNLIATARAHIETRTGLTLTSADPNAGIDLPLRQAILLLTGHLYEHRGGEDTIRPEPIFIDALIQPYRTVHL